MIRSPSVLSRLILVLFAVFALIYVLVGIRARPKAARVSDRQGSKMTRGEALLVLVLSEGATKDEISAAFRQLVRKVHPDIPGGSAYLTSQINHARDVLLG